ncbi:MAG: ABC transporter permease [Clostridiales bacterium]|nr:ABC transporter permease [Clostridiales bacterium]MDD7122656.1 ABC transporter permease [Clostridiales bacterium]MDY5467858.1 ABC transporter permease [Eubacteriales bacterium]
MLKYIVKRIGMALATLLVIIFVLFVLVRIMPGNPFPSERMSATQIANKRAEMGLDDPILLQFVRYMKNVLRGDFGKGSSLYNGAPIKTVLSSCVSNSFRIGGLAILIGTVLGLLLGVCAALHRGKFLDGFCTVFSIVGVCVPSYVFLIFLQYNFSYKVSFFPYFFDSSRFLFSAILPALSLSLFTMSTIARFTRNEMVEVIDSDYVRLAESKGMEGGLLIRRHVLRNALVPIVTVLAPLIVDLLTGALVVEKIYGINGIGKLMVDAIAGEGVDYNYVLALGILYSSLYIGMMLAVDILYGILDPRIRVSAKGEA